MFDSWLTEHGANLLLLVRHLWGGMLATDAAGTLGARGDPAASYFDLSCELCASPQLLRGWIAHDLADFQAKEFDIVADSD